MTTNDQIKCPVCGEGMNNPVDKNYYWCEDSDCPLGYNEYPLHKDTIKDITTRIDKEKAAAVKVAVQQERERVISSIRKYPERFQSTPWFDRMEDTCEEIIKRLPNLT